MSNDQRASRPQGRTLGVTVRLLGVRGDDVLPDVHVYAFTSQGRACDVRRVTAEGRVELVFPATAQKALILVGPEVEGATLSELRRLGAAEKGFYFDGREPSLVVEAWRPVWSNWSPNRCCVQGHVRKADDCRGVCDATVEVYEVEPLHLVLQKLPDVAIEAVQAVAVRPVDASLPRTAERLGEFFPGAEPVEPALAKILRDLPEAAREVARSGCAARFRQALLRSPEVLRRLFHLLHPRWVTRQKVGEGTTSREGRFDVSFYPSASTGGRPGLWFRVTQNVPGQGTVTIYERFPVSCHTWWSHDGASEVALTTSHPLARSVDDADRIGVRRVVPTVRPRRPALLMPPTTLLKGVPRSSFALVA